MWCHPEEAQVASYLNGVILSEAKDLAWSRTVRVPRDRDGPRKILKD